MNKLAISTLLLVGLLQSSACVFYTDEERVIEEENVYLDVSWDVNCPDNVTAVLVARNQDASAQVYTNVYNCEDLKGMTTAMAPGIYDVWLEVTDNAQKITYSQSGSLVADLSVVGTTKKLAIPKFAFDGIQFVVSWTAPEICPNGGIVQLVTQSRDSSIQFAREADRFDCTAGVGSAFTRPSLAKDNKTPAVYDAWLEVYDSGFTTLIGKSDPVVAEPAFIRSSDPFNGVAALDIPLFLTDKAYMKLSWDMTNLNDGDAPLTCEEIKSAEVRVTATVVNSDDFHVEEIDCAKREAFTKAVLLGSYKVKVKALNSENLVIDEPYDSKDVVLSTGSEVVVVPKFLLSIDK